MPQALSATHAVQEESVGGPVWRVGGWIRRITRFLSTSRSFKAARPKPERHYYAGCLSAAAVIRERGPYGVRYARTTDRRAVISSIHAHRPTGFSSRQRDSSNTLWSEYSTTQPAAGMFSFASVAFCCWFTTRWGLFSMRLKSWRIAGSIHRSGQQTEETNNAKN